MLIAFLISTTYFSYPDYLDFLVETAKIFVEECRLCS